MPEYFAHKNKRGDTELLSEHLQLVAARASAYAATFDASTEAYTAGLLHDIGKYGELFQRRLKGEVSGIDHWSAGAWEALSLFQGKGIAAALAIQGHHIGLQCGSKESLGKLDPKNLLSNHPLNLTLSEIDPKKLVSRFQNDGLHAYSMDELNPSIYRWGENTAASMVDVRMLFSSLTDADFIETEAWFGAEKGIRQYRVQGLPLEPDIALRRLTSYMDTLSRHSDAAPTVKEIRSELLKACLKSADLPPGLFTLTAPTGSGKTLSMLAFALAHAVTYHLERIILVIPYLNIIEQTVKVYRKIYQPYFTSDELDRYILEHHSLSGIKTLKSSLIEDEDYQRRTLTENWDAPIVITTNVQLLESLFSNRPSACRKLHHLARSVILFDEVQTMPVSLAIPSLAVLSRIAERYRSSIVFATATQPAFSHLDKYVRQHCASGWQPREIVPNEANLFARSKRNIVVWPQGDKQVPLLEIANQLSQNKQVLCVVNLKKHAKVIFEALKEITPQSVFHLSTSMCPAHRQDTLERVRMLLNEQKTCRLVSTQCIEAGVDIDFPVVYRALGPLDAIAQAAGRCNRNGHLNNGTVYVFKPHVEDKGRLYPDGAYSQGANVTSVLLNQTDLNDLDITDPELFQRYYRELYLVRGVGTQDENTDPLLNAIKRQDFVGATQNYRIIDQDTINVLVPYDREAYTQLRNEALNNGLSRQWILKVRPYIVSLFRPKSADDPLYLALETIKLKLKMNEDSDEWFIYHKEEDYDYDTGLNPSLSPNLNIA